MNILEHIAPTTIKWISITYVLLMIGVIIKLILENRRPLKTYTYILLIFALPVIGIIIFFATGKNYRKKHKFQKRNEFFKQFFKEKITEIEDQFDLEKKNGLQKYIEESKLPGLFYNTARTSITLNNRLQLFSSGEDKLKALLNDLETAEHHIHLEYFTIETKHKIWEQLFPVLKKRREAGVEIRILYDALGSKMEKSALKELTNLGIEHSSYMPIWIPGNLTRGNYRDHRKIVVIDGKIGYTGGVNIGDEYINDGRNDEYWRDTHLKIEGDAVTQLQLLFFVNWQFASGKELQPFMNYLAKETVSDELAVSVVGSNASKENQTIMEGFFAMITNAKKRVWINTPYFLPNETILSSLAIVAKSGVDVRMIIPKSSDSFLVNYACKSYVKELLENEVKVFLYEKGMMHAKTLLVDENICTIGTSNMDHRSFELNDEVNAFIFDQAFTQQLAELFEKDLEDSCNVSIESWSKRSIKSKVLESFCRLVSPMM